MHILHLLHFFRYAKTFLDCIGAESVKSVSKTKHYFFDKI